MPARTDATDATDPGGPEWSAASILGTRLGRELVERLVDPLLGGINAGGLDQLSLIVVAPQVAKALVGHRSVTRALRPAVPQHPEAATRRRHQHKAVLPRDAGRTRPYGRCARGRCATPGRTTPSRHSGHGPAAGKGPLRARHNRRHDRCGRRGGGGARVRGRAGCSSTVLQRPPRSSVRSHIRASRSSRSPGPRTP